MAEVPHPRAPRCLLLAVTGALLVWVLPAVARSTPAAPGAGGPPVFVAGSPRGTVAIAKGSKGRRCATGTLAATDLVITCQHVIDLYPGSEERWPATSLEVQLEGAAGEPTRRFPVLEYAWISEAHDLCVLRIGADEAGGWPEADRVQTFSRRRVGLDAAIYVAHHPRGRPLEIAVGGRVYFPFEATAKELRRIETRLAYDGGTAGQMAARLEEFRASYRRGANGHFLNFSRRWAGQPVIGAACLTFHGSSGAPVYDARTHELVGILFAGVDQTRPDVPSRWDHHEAILPAAPILEDLARSADPAVRALAAPGS